MIVRDVYYSEDFRSRLKNLPEQIVKIAARKEKIFRENPLHSSLRLHGLKGNLKGLWSISITKSYRIIFERVEGGDIFFISIGKHDIYRSL